MSAADPTAALMALAAQSVAEEQEIAGQRDQSPFAVAQVVKVVASSDGRTCVQLSWSGGLAWDSSRAGSYTPVVGHWVLCARHVNQLIPLIKLVNGGPPSA